jgi:hypothetical protein
VTAPEPTPEQTPTETPEPATKPWDAMKFARIALAVAGIALLGFGVLRLLTQVSTYSLTNLAVWLVAALVLHDLVLAPTTIGVGWVLRRWVPDRARRYVQGWLIVSATLAVIAIPMIVLRGSQPVVKALLLRNYGANLALLVGLAAAVSALLYLRRVVADRVRER